MIASYWLIGIALVALQPVEGEAGGPAPESDIPAAADTPQVVRGEDVVKRDVAAFASQCGERRFETAVVSNNEGKARRAKILLCAKPGETDEQWIATLEKAASSVVASPELPIEARAKIAGEIQAEIARLRESN